MKVKTESKSEAKIVLTILQELTGLKVGSLTIEQYLDKWWDRYNYAAGVHRSKEYLCLWDWQLPLPEVISFREFMCEAMHAKLGDIKVGEYVVNFREGGIQVGCTFVPTATVDVIHARLHKSA